MKSSNIHNIVADSLNYYVQPYSRVSALGTLSIALEHGALTTRSGWVKAHALSLSGAFEVGPRCDTSCMQYYSYFGLVTGR